MALQLKEPTPKQLYPKASVFDKGLGFPVDKNPTFLWGCGVK